MPLATDEFYIAGITAAHSVCEGRAGVVTSMQLQQRFSVWIDLPKGDQPLPPIAATVEIDPALYDQYVGDYQLGPGLVLTITVTDGKLFAQASGEAPLELAPRRRIASSYQGLMCRSNLRAMPMALSPAWCCSRVARR
ncbi:MAG: hypothetical protein R3E79_48730 [Caldilineaceae bacterium]